MAKMPGELFGGEDAPAKAGAPSVTETPEFKAALAEMRRESDAAITAMKQELLSTLASSANVSAGSAGVPAAVTELFQSLALNIAEMTHQGDKRVRPLDPRVAAERAAAKDRMDALISDARRAVHDARAKSYASEDARAAATRAVSPKYRAIAKVHFGDRIIDPFRRDDATKRAEPVEFYWLDEPNDALRPANALAEAIFEQFRLSRGSRTAIEQKAIKPAWMTDRGLVIEGDKMPARRGIEQERAARDDDLDMPAYRDPEAPFINVLGTLQEPARQNYEGQVP